MCRVVVSLIFSFRTPVSHNILHFFLTTEPRPDAHWHSPVQHGSARGLLVPVDSCSLMLGAALGHAMLAYSGPATARSGNALLGTSSINLSISAPRPCINTFDSPARRPAQRRSGIPAVCVSQNAKSCSCMSSIGHSTSILARRDRTPSSKASGHLPLLSVSLAVQRLGWDWQVYRCAWRHHMR